MKKIFLIDGNSLLYRAYFATGSLTNNLGFPTNALYGLSNMLLRILAKKPDYVVAAFDTKEKTFRHEIFPDYKAQRKPPEEQLVMQMAPARDIVRAFGVTVIEMPGFEGDDIIGTIAKKVNAESRMQKAELNPPFLEFSKENSMAPPFAVARGDASITQNGEGKTDVNPPKNSCGILSPQRVDQVCIWTGDLDSLQLVDENISIYHTVKGVSDVKIYDAQAVFDRYGVTVEQFIDFKGLKGDPSDNIPGVPGIGDKTAAKLLTDYGSIQGIYDSIDSMKESKMKKNLVEYKEQAFLSKDLATINTNIPLEIDLEKWAFKGFNHNELYHLATKYQFHSLYNFIDKSQVSEESPFEKNEEIPLENDKINIEEIKPVVIEDDKALNNLIKLLEVQEEISIYFDFVPETGRFVSCSVYVPGNDNSQFTIHNSQCPPSKFSEKICVPPVGGSKKFASQILIYISYT